MKRAELRKLLENSADQKLKNFSEKLTPTALEILGVRVPVLRKIANDIAKNDGELFLKNEACNDSFEEVLIQGLVIGYAPFSADLRERFLKDFVPKIDNWAVCDTVCSTIKVTEKYRERTRKFLNQYLNSNNEFEVRFGVVMLLDNFLVEKEISYALAVFAKISHPGYYAKMAVAWALSVAFVKFPAQTMEIFSAGTLDSWTHNKAIQKICESFRVPAEEKLKLRMMKICRSKAE